MARHLFGSQGRKKGQITNRVYTILALLIVTLVIVFIFSPGLFGPGDNENQIVEPGPEPADTETNIPVMSFMTAETEQETTLPEQDVTQPDVSEESTAEMPFEPVVEPNSDIGRLIAEATELLNERPIRVLEARDKFNETLRMSMSAQQRTFVKNQLSQLADKWLFNRTVLPGDELCDNYSVEPGDQLRIIGEQHKVPFEILMQINNIRRAENLQAGQTIKIVNGPFHAKVYRSTFTMDLYLQNTFVQSFPVGLGKPGMETPTGLWRVKPGGKLEKPIWTDPITGKTYHPEDPDYPLGSRWIALEGLTGAAKGRDGFAIHGTHQPEQLGSAGSQGCIRMENGEAILVYNLLVPVFSTVEVVD
jgi:LysM repeat protein